MKRLLSYLLISLLALTAAQAQTAREAMDKAAAKLQKSGGLRAKFTATTFNAKLAKTGSSTGTICVEGNKFKCDADGMTTWFDGKTQWTTLQGSGEVNVSTPTKQEAAQMNPYTFVNLYRQGYSMSMKSVTYAGKPCHEINMLSSGKGNIPRMIVILSADYTPLNVRMKDARGQWVRFAVSSLQTGQKFPKDFFRFDKAKHPNLEIIDLR